MSNILFEKDDVKLLVLLRSKCYKAKMNFKKMYKHDLKCSLKCDSEETQQHIFEECIPIKNKIKAYKNIKIDDIYGSESEQKEAITYFIEIEKIRNTLLEK